MKAAVVEKPGVLVVREVPVPVPGEYDALCRLLYGATCTGTDRHLITGRFPFFPIQYPTILGHESVGEVVEVGRRVRHLKPGDLLTRVGAPASEGLSTNWGGFAEYGLARDHWAMREDGRPPAEWQDSRVNQILPPGTDPRAAPMMTTWRETLSCSSRMGIGGGKSVLVIGSGGVGLSFVAHARNLGAGTVALVGSARRADVGRAAGATLYFDYRAEGLGAVLKAAQPEGFDYIIDAVGRSGQVDRFLAQLKPGGMVTIYGIDDYHAAAINPHLARGTFTVYSGDYDEAETHERVLSFWQQGRLDPRLWLDLDHPFALRDITEAFAALEDGSLIKALVRLSDQVSS
jgi:NADPH:quinone reductase-like Zn-dependent oxidoreductase